MVTISGQMTHKNNIILDDKDKIILSYLTIDARVPLSKISKKVRLSKSNVARRIKILQDKDIISEFNAIINAKKVNVNSSILLCKSKGYSRQLEDFFYNCTNIPEVYSIVHLNDSFDIFIGFYYKTDVDKQITCDKLLNSEIISEYKLIDINTLFPKLDYFANLFNKPDFSYKSEVKEISNIIDNVDVAILKELSINCRQNNESIAKKINVPKNVITYRIKKLLHKGIIAKMQPTINILSLNFGAYLLSLKLKKVSECNAIINFLYATNRVNNILISKNDYTIFAFIHFKDYNEFYEFDNKLSEKHKSNIFEHSYSIARKQYKLDWFPKILQTI